MGWNALLLIPGMGWKTMFFASLDWHGQNNTIYDFLQVGCAGNHRFFELLDLGLGWNIISFEIPGAGVGRKSLCLAPWDGLETHVILKF